MQSLQIQGVKCKAEPRQAGAPPLPRMEHLSPHKGIESCALRPATVGEEETQGPHPAGFKRPEDGLPFWTGPSRRVADGAPFPSGAALVLPWRLEFVPGCFSRTYFLRAVVEQVLGSFMAAMAERMASSIGLPPSNGFSPDFFSWCTQGGGMGGRERETPSPIRARPGPAPIPREASLTHLEGAGSPLARDLLQLALLHRPLQGVLQQLGPKGEATERPPGWLVLQKG